MTRLKLKGAPPRNLKKTVKKVEKIIQAVDEHENIVDEVEPEGWIMAESVADLVGPIVLISSEGTVLAIDQDGKPSIQSDEINVEEFEPLQVSQVLVGKMLLPGVFCLQSSQGRYLSSDQIGKVMASKEAVGPSERWTPELLNGSFAFRSAFGKYLSPGDETVGVRADSEERGEKESFYVKCQAVQRWRRERSERKGNVEALRKQHLLSLDADPKLEEARARGDLHETLLDERIKEKHDKYC